jgi:hypothetical protein
LKKLKKSSKYVFICTRLNFEKSFNISERGANSRHLLNLTLGYTEKLTIPVLAVYWEVSLKESFDRNYCCSKEKLFVA